VSICMNQFLAMFHKYNARRSLLFIPAPQPNQLLLRGGGTTVSPIYLSFEIQQESNITNINDYYFSFKKNICENSGHQIVGQGKQLFFWMMRVIYHLLFFLFHAYNWLVVLYSHQTSGYHSIQVLNKEWHKQSICIYVLMWPNALGNIK